jgi:hypothetical protein
MLRSVLLALLATVLTGCITLVSAYDPFFDQSLNKLSEDTAKFLAAAQHGGQERLAGSKEAVAYYAATYDLLDRLSARAAATRGSIRCPTNASLQEFYEQRSAVSKLPEDYLKFDCREFQLYAVRHFVEQLDYAERSGGVLTPFEASANGVPLQTAIKGAIQTFNVTKS